MLACTGVDVLGSNLDFWLYWVAVFFNIIPEPQYFLICHPGIASAASDIRDPENECHSGLDPGSTIRSFLLLGPGSRTRTIKSMKGISD